MRSFGLAIMMAVLLAAFCFGGCSSSKPPLLQQITASDGSAWGPDWSPYGDQVAFCSDRAGNQDIWIFDVSGKEEVQWQVTGTPDEETNPSWSPSGSLLAYVSGPDTLSSIWMCPAWPSGGDFAMCFMAADSVFNYTDPAWDLDGQGIICIALGRVEPICRLIKVFWYEHRVEILHEVEWEILSQPQPTVESIYFTYNSVMACPPRPEIWRYDRPTGECQSVLADSTIGYSGGVVSPNGRYLAYVTDQFEPKKIQVRDLKGNDPVVTLPTSGMALGPAWSPDSKHLAFSQQTVPADSLAGTAGVSDIFIYSFDH